MAEENVAHEFPIINPRSIDQSVLIIQDVHISTRIWNQEDVPKLNLRTHALNVPLPNQVVEYLEMMGLFGVAMIENISLDNGYIAAMIERWRPETHTFHLLHGEMTVTLEDIAILLGIPSIGKPVIVARMARKNKEMKRRTKMSKI